MVQKCEANALIQKCRHLERSSMREGKIFYSSISIQDVVFLRKRNHVKNNGNFKHGSISISSYLTTATLRQN